MSELTSAAALSSASGASPVCTIPGPRPQSGPPSPASLFGLALTAAEIRSDLGMGLLHLASGGLDSATDWFHQVELRLLAMEKALTGAASAQGVSLGARGVR